MPMGDFHRYVTRLAHDLDRRFDPTPELSARPALQELLEELVADKEFIVIAEPRRSAAGCPDFVIKSKIGLNVGHIETKPPRAWRDLERDTNSEQLQRYRANFPNLLLTDYVHAVLLRDGKEIGRADLVTTLNVIDSKRRESRFDKHFLFEWSHRPGDRRYVYLAPGIIKEYRKNVTPSAMATNNVTLAVASGGSGEATYAWVSDGPMPQAVLSPRTHGRAGLFSAQMYAGAPGLFGPDENLSISAIGQFKRNHGNVPSGRKLLDYVYGVLWSSWWRSQFAHKPFEDDDYPRIPIALDIDDFKSIAAAGARLVELHLLRTAASVPLKATGKDLKILELRHDPKTKTLLLGDWTLGPIETEDLQFTVGGYRILQQWFEVRNGDILGVEELAHLRKLVGAIRETPARVKAIDSTLHACSRGKGFIEWEEIPRDTISVTTHLESNKPEHRRSARSASSAESRTAKRKAPKRQG